LLDIEAIIEEVAMVFATMLALAIAQSAPLTPSGKWTVDYQPTMCVAARQFGPAGNATYLAFQPPVSMDTLAVKLFILAPNASGTGVERGRATITLQPSGQTEWVDYVSWIPKRGGPRGYEMEADAAFMAQLEQSTGLSVNAGKESVNFASGKMQRVLAAMATCNARLMRSWGVDTGAKAEAIGSPGDWFSYKDYPAAALRRSAQGRAVIIVTVDSDGKTKACRIAVTSGDPDLDRGTCDIAKRRGRYVRKNGGERFAVYSIRWMLD